MDKRKSKYTIDELYSIRHETISKLYKKYTIPGKNLTARERCVLLEQGKVAIKKGVLLVDALDKIHCVFDFSEYEYPPQVDHAVVDKLIEELTITYTSIKDTVSLGDEDTALSILKEFREYAHGLMKDGG